jgi:outer membrane protein OmpA-like peptidoglycan-associated protein
MTALPAKVYFDVGVAVLGPEGQKTVDDVIATVSAQDLTVTITGYTDRTGNVGQNIELAKQRALAVRDALLDAGVPAGQIIMKPPLTITTTGSGSDAEARRVEISPVD